MGIDPKKYVTFKREELVQLFGKYGLPKGDEDCAPVAEAILVDLDEAELKDAVVIRRQDMFAPSALHGYASSIAIAAQITDGPESVKLRQLSDYFHEQAVAAEAEAFKLPID